MKIRKFRKLAAVLLALCLVVGMLPMSAMAAEGHYTDTGGHWAEAAIEKWSDYGVVGGYGNGTFVPNASMTRAEFASALCKMLGLTETPAGTPFTDVKAGSWYELPILKLYEAGIMMGVGGGRADPEAKISREEAFVMLGRALGVKPKTSSTAVSGFKDSGKVSSWAAPMLSALVEGGFVSGVGDNTLAPDADINRASVMTVINNTVTNYVTEPGVHENTGSGFTVIAVEDASADVTITGDTAGVVISQTSDSVKVNISNAVIAGDVKVDAPSASVTVTDSKVEGAVEITSNAKDTTLDVAAGSTVETVETKADGAAVTGSGEVKNVEVTGGTDVSVTTPGTEVTVDAGATDTTVTTGSGTVSAGGSSTTTGAGSGYEESSSGGGTTSGGGGTVTPAEPGYTRASFAVDMVEALGLTLPDNADPLPFTDLEGLDDAAKNAIHILSAHGMISGTDSATFSPNETVTRGMAATMLMRAAGFSDYIPTLADKAAVTDVIKNTPIYFSATFAVHYGLMTASGKAFSPDTACKSGDITWSALENVPFPVSSFDELKAALANHETDIAMVGRIEVSEATTIPSGVTVTMQDRGELIVNAGVALTIAEGGTLLLSDNDLTGISNARVVEVGSDADGSLLIDPIMARVGNIDIRGTLTVNGTLTVGANTIVNVYGSMTGTGTVNVTAAASDRICGYAHQNSNGYWVIDSRDQTMDALPTREVDGVTQHFYAWGNDAVVEALTSDDGTVTLTEADVDGITLRVEREATATIGGNNHFNYLENNGTLNVNKALTLDSSSFQNNSDLNVNAALTVTGEEASNDGTITVNGSMTIDTANGLFNYGTLTVTDDGSLSAEGKLTNEETFTNNGTLNISRFNNGGRATATINGTVEGAVTVIDNSGTMIVNTDVTVTGEIYNGPNMWVEDNVVQHGAGSLTLASGVTVTVAGGFNNTVGYRPGSDDANATMVAGMATVEPGASLTVGGTLYSNSDITVSGTLTLNGSHSTISAFGDESVGHNVAVTVNAGGTLNVNGILNLYGHKGSTPETSYKTTLTVNGAMLVRDELTLHTWSGVESPVTAENKDSYIVPDSGGMIEIIAKQPV